MSAPKAFSFWSRNRWFFSPWTLAFILIAALICLPVFALLTGLQPASLLQIPKLFVAEFALNTYLLLGLTGAISLLFAIPAAWFTATAEFPGRKAFEWLMVLPLAIPAYIMAYTYKGIFDPFGTTRKWFDFYVEIDNLPVLAVLMAAVLYPYVFLVSKSVFSKNARRLEEVAQSLGHSRQQTFFKLILPLARPAIFGGLSLVAMEVFNNYGAVKYYGIKTFTTELIRLWNPLDLQPVIRIAGVLLLLIFLLFQAERWERRKARHFESGSAQLSRVRIPLSGGSAFLAWISCFIPLLIGFIIPVIQLGLWAVNSFSRVFDLDFLTMTLNTFFLAVSAALLCMSLAVFMGFVNRLFPRKFIAALTRISGLGYAVPGAVIGIGILVPLTLISRNFGVVLTGSMSILIYAYAVRFQAVAYQAVDAGFKKHSPNLLAAARSLGSNPWSALWKIELPLLKPALLASTILVFVDVTKELPLTMLFQRFNFETLAVRAFVLMETDGAVYDSSVPALIIVLIGLIPVFLLNRVFNQKDVGTTSNQLDR